MFRALKHIIATIIRRGSQPSDPSGDPRAGVREPTSRRPGGRSSAVAVVEPRADELIDVRAASARSSTMRSRATTT
jgi:hypothetical protein